MSNAKPFSISKREVFDAWREVKANRGAPGIDGQTISEFEENLSNNLFKLWNRMASGSYFPPPVKEVEIPKPGGGIRKLGVPTVSDRIAQTVIRRQFEPALDEQFHPDSYAYRAGKSALSAIDTVRRRCWQYDWVLEFDIEKAFDSLNHKMMMKAILYHNPSPWVKLYIERWLKASKVTVEGQIEQRERGTPQGGVISPLMFNLYLHYTYDAWMGREFPGIPFARYADDGLAHCRTQAEAETLRLALAERLAACGLRLHPTKTQVVYCKDANRKSDFSCTQFDFLGYTFRRRLAKSWEGKYFMSFAPAISGKSSKRVRQVMRQWTIPRWTTASIEAIADRVNPTLRGWWTYFGAFYPSVFKLLIRRFNEILLKWVRRKYKRFRNSRHYAKKWLEALSKRESHLFFHWQLGVMPMAEQ